VSSYWTTTEAALGPQLLLSIEERFGLPRARPRPYSRAPTPHDERTLPPVRSRSSRSRRRRESRRVRTSRNRAAIAGWNAPTGDSLPAPRSPRHDHPARRSTPKCPQTPPRGHAEVPTCASVGQVDTDVLSSRSGRLRASQACRGTADPARLRGPFRKRGSVPERRSS
jgi:hypothetical protein